MSKFNNIFVYLSNIKDYLSNDIASIITDVNNIQEHQTKNSTYSKDTNYVCNDGHNIVSGDQFDRENISEAVIKIPTETEATGIENGNKMIYGNNNITIVGVASAIAISTSEATANSENESIVDSQAIANASAVSEAVGLINQNKIITGKGNDTIVGVAISEVTGLATGFSQSKSTSANFSSATANSESSVLLDATAVGIDNQGVITTGQGSDFIVGMASTTTMGSAEATALTNSITALADESDISTINEIETAIAESTANAMATSQTTTLGIINSGKILTGRGDDLIIGLASNTSFIDVQTTAEAESTANDIARATAEAESFGIAEGFAVGIVNSNRINTGRGNDIVIGFAVNNVTVNSNAQADAEANAIDSDTQTNSDTIADTFRAISIGIDNASGLLMTSQGDDQVFGVGTVGITGGNFILGKGNDRIIGYGSTVGVEEAKINLGQGDDLFQSAIVDVDPVTGGISFADDQSGSIKNTNIIGGRGNDTFDLGGFEETVSIDGGRDHDELRLGGNLDDYQINLNSSDNKSLSIKDGESILIVKNVESFHFGDRDRIYNFDDFA